MKEKLEKYILDNIVDIIFTTIIGIILSTLIIITSSIKTLEDKDNLNKQNISEDCTVVEKTITGQDALFFNIFVKCNNESKRIKVTLDQYFNIKIQQKIKLPFEE